MQQGEERPRKGLLGRLEGMGQTSASRELFLISRDESYALRVENTHRLFFSLSSFRLSSSSHAAPCCSSLLVSPSLVSSLRPSSSALARPLSPSAELSPNLHLAPLLHSILCFPLISCFFHAFNYWGPLRFPFSPHPTSSSSLSFFTSKHALTVAVPLNRCFLLLICSSGSKISL